MILTYRTLVIIVLIFTQGIAAEKNTADFVVEAGSSDWRPYAYEEDGVVKGSAYKIAKDVFERAGIPLHYEIQPWARVYHFGLTRKNYMIGGLGRTPKREKLFHWVGPVSAGFDIYFWQLKSNPIQIESIEELKKHTIGVKRATYFEDFVELKEFDKNKIQAVSEVEQLLKMAQLKRISFFLLNKKRLLEEAKRINLDPNLFEKVFFAFNVTDYMAMNLDTDPELLEKLQNAYKELEKEGKIKKE